MRRVEKGVFRIKLAFPCTSLSFASTSRVRVVEVREYTGGFSRVKAAPRIFLATRRDHGATSALRLSALSVHSLSETFPPP